MYSNITPVITGTQIAYYIICHRKLWLFNKNISLEHTSELVEIGKLIHEASYIHEVKKSKALEESHAWQLKYYIYYCKQMGIEVEGIIDYPKLRRREKISLSMEDEEKIKNILNAIYVLMDNDTIPSVINKPYCKKCSYYEFCYC